MAVNSIPPAASDQKTSQSDTKQRATNPGVRVIGGTIYDSEKGKTCHQCRQKTRSITAACKNKKKDKPCTLLFCHKCLLNRYGENAEEVEVLEEWICPKCRGICNCSCCRKKQGHQPTGILTHKAKATGYSSVSELLHANGPENFGIVKNVKDTGASPKKPSASGKQVTSPGKKGKENLLDGRVDMNLEHPTPSKLKEIKRMQGGTLENIKKRKKTKQGKLKTVSAGQKDAAALKSFSSGALSESTPNKSQDSDTVSAGQKDAAALKLCTFGALPESNSNKSQDSDTSIHKDAKLNGKINDPEVGDGCLKNVSTQVPADTFGNKKRNVDNDIEVIDQEKIKKRVKHDTCMPVVKDTKSGLQFQSREIDNIPLPHGTELITIGDVELPPEDVGNALQFLEFCAAFGKNLNMKKGQSSVILKELMNGQSRTLRRSEHHSPLVHFHIQLLTLLQKDQDSRPKKLSPSPGKNSWLFALKSCLSESPNAIDLLTIDGLDSESGGYNTLNFSMKLRILIFLCDEVLETERIRDWINNQQSKFAQKAKQAKEKYLAAKDKEKSLKQKLTDELAKAITAKDDSSFSISEHDKMVSQIKCEATRAHEEMLESMNMVPKAKKRSQALRTQPIFVDGDGRAFWRLNCYSEESNILVQDIGNGDDSIVFGEKWTTFDNEQEKVVEKHISLRERMARTQSAASSRTNV